MILAAAGAATSSASASASASPFTAAGCAGVQPPPDSRLPCTRAVCGASMTRKRPTAGWPGCSPAWGPRSCWQPSNWRLPPVFRWRHLLMRHCPPLHCPPLCRLLRRRQLPRAVPRGDGSSAATAAARRQAAARLQVAAAASPASALSRHASTPSWSWSMRTRLPSRGLAPAPLLRRRTSWPGTKNSRRSRRHGRAQCTVLSPTPAGYVLGPAFLTDPAAALGAMEAAALPVYGDAIALSDGAVRAWAVSALQAAARRTAHWGGPAEPGPRRGP